MRKLFAVCLAVAGLAVPTSLASAQQMVHALGGTVSNVDAKEGTIAIDTDDGSRGTFKAAAKVPSDMDKNLSSDATPAVKFTATSTHVIVYYFGNGEIRTAVALHDLGNGTLEKNSGTIVRFDKHAHVMTIKCDAGTEISFHIAPKTVAETATGAVVGYKFDPEKGDHVRVTATPENGSETALFIASAF